MGGRPGRAPGGAGSRHGIQVVHGGKGLAGPLLRAIVKTHRRVYLDVRDFVLISERKAMVGLKQGKSCGYQKFETFTGRFGYIFSYMAGPFGDKLEGNIDGPTIYGKNNSQSVTYFQELLPVENLGYSCPYYAHAYLSKHFQMKSF